MQNMTVPKLSTYTDWDNYPLCFNVYACLEMLKLLTQINTKVL